MSDHIACVLAAIILADDNQEVSAASMGEIFKAAGIEVEHKWVMLFSQFFQGKNVMDLLTSVSAAPAAGAVAAAPVAVAEEEKKEEKKEESEEEVVVGAGGLFGGDSDSDESDSDSDEDDE